MQHSSCPTISQTSYCSLDMFIYLYMFYKESGKVSRYLRKGMLWMGTSIGMSGNSIMYYLHTINIHLLINK